MAAMAATAMAAMAATAMAELEEQEALLEEEVPADKQDHHLMVEEKLAGLPQE